MQKACLSEKCCSCLFSPLVWVKWLISRHGLTITPFSFLAFSTYPRMRIASLATFSDGTANGRAFSPSVLGACRTARGFAVLERRALAPHQNALAFCRGHNRLSLFLTMDGWVGFTEG